MASTDFSTHVYSYAEVENDFDLEHFALAKEDIEMKVRAIREKIGTRINCQQFYIRTYLCSSTNN